VFDLEFVRKKFSEKSSESEAEISEGASSARIQDQTVRGADAKALASASGSSSSRPGGTAPPRPWFSSPVDTC